MKTRKIIFYGNNVFINEGLGMRLNSAPTEEIDVSSATEVEMNQLRQNPKGKLLDKFRKK